MTRRSAPKGAPQTPAKKSNRKRSTRYIPNLPGRPTESYWAALLDDADRGELEEVDA